MPPVKQVGGVGPMIARMHCQRCFVFSWVKLAYSEEGTATPLHGVLFIFTLLFSLLLHLVLLLIPPRSAQKLLARLKSR